MKKVTFCLLLAALLTIIYSGVFAQQNQNTQKPNPEIEALKIQLQTVENEKIELTVKLLDAQAKLAEAQAKLRDAEFGKFKNELRESNNEWLKSWSLWFLTIIGIFAAILIGVSYVFWYWLRTRADQSIADGVEKNLNGFKDAVGQVHILQDQIRILKKEHAVSVLENAPEHYLRDEDFHTEQIKALQEEVLLQVFEDETRLIEIRCGAADVLAVRKSLLLVAPLLEFLNLVVDSDFDWEASGDTRRLPFRFLSFFGEIQTNEAHQGLKKFLNRLLTENPKHKDWFLLWTAGFLADIDIKLELNDSVSMMKKVIPNLNNLQPLPQVVGRLVEYFDTFNAPDGIKDILTNGLTNRMPEVETRCLELLQKHDPDFIEKWKAQKEDTS